MVQLRLYLSKLFTVLSIVLVAATAPVAAQVFDEQFDHWPVDLRLKGTVIVSSDLVPDRSLAGELPTDTKASDVVVVLEKGTAAEQLTPLRDALGLLGDQESDPNNDAEQEEAQQAEEPPGEAAGDWRKIEIDGDWKQRLGEALSSARVCVWWHPGEATFGHAEFQRVESAMRDVAKFVQGGGTLVSIGAPSSWWGACSVNAKRHEAGVNLLPDVCLGFNGGKMNRSATLTAIAARPRSVGVELDRGTYLILAGRKIRLRGPGRATFVLMATEHLPLRVESIGEASSRRQSPLEYLIDLTEWRRDAIDRSIERFPPLQPKTPLVENGTLVIVGGGGMPDGLMQRFVDLAGGVDEARLVYVPCTEAEEVSENQGIVRLWERMGVKHATFIHTKDRRKANEDEEFLKPLRDATGIWFGGGRQWNMADSYYGTTAHKLMKDVVVRGGVIGGSSAGASIQARYLARATPIQNYRIMAPGYERGGLGFLSGVAIDQHFSQRKRQADMTRLVDRYPQLLGIGLDEATAIVVRGSKAEVVGRGKVYFYDRNLPVFPGHPDYIALPDGGEYDLAARRVLKDPTATPRGRVTSPEVHDDGRITFRLNAPEAKGVEVRGLDGQPTLALTRQPNGVWEGTTQKLPPELYSYTFRVDGANFTDPANRHVKKWLSCANLVEVPGMPPRLHEMTDVPHGTVHRHLYRSTVAQEADNDDLQVAQRGVYVYTPPGYADSKASYPVLVLMHGFGDDESAWTEVGKANYIADNLLAQGVIRPMVIVMPYGHPVSLDQRQEFDDYASRNIAAMERDLLEDLLPMIYRRYRVSQEASATAIAGLSMGGGQSLTIGLRNPARFSRVGGFSSSAPQGSAAEIAEQLRGLNRQTAEKHLPLIWVACGEDDFLLDRNKKFVDWLEQSEIPHSYHQSPGGHDWIVWRKYLADFLTQAFPAAK